MAWQCKQQGDVARSSAYSEYMAADDMVTMVVHIRQLLAAIGLEMKEPTKCRLDNTAAIAWSNGLGKEAAQRCVKVCYHAVQQHRERKEVEFSWVRTADMPADMMTKPLDRQKLRRCLGLAMGRYASPEDVSKEECSGKCDALAH